MNSLGARPVGWDGHLLLLYRSEAERRAGVSTWVQRGLELGAKILYTEPPEQPAGRSLLELLQDQGDASNAVERGQIEVVLADEIAHDPAWQAGMVDRALDQGYPSVRWSGEAAAAWSVMPRAQHANLEQATDVLCRSQPLSVMCQYSVSDAGAELAWVCKVHGAGLRERQMTVIPFEGGMRVAGEVDRSNQEILCSVLSSATSTEERDHFVVDLYDLDFLDMGGIRGLVQGTASYRELGGSVRLQGVRSHVDHVIRLVRVDRSHGMLIEGV